MIDAYPNWMNYEKEEVKMDIRIEKLVNDAKDKWGLENYYLYSYNLHRKIDVFQETKYFLSMEWFPSIIKKWKNKDFNPEGAAVIELELKSHQYVSVIFVGGKTYASKNLLQKIDSNSVIKWIENETGLTCVKQFLLEKEEGREFYFRGCINGIPISPFASMEIHFDEEGKLTFFSVHGEFPAMDMIRNETFSLQLKEVGQLAREQFKLIEIPSFEQQQFLKIYTIEEIYISNNHKTTLPFGISETEGRLVKIEGLIYYEAKKGKRMKRKVLNIMEDLTPGQAFSFEPHPDLTSITQDEIRNSNKAVEDFLSRQYPNDSGKWIFKTLHRDNGYIVATLRLNGQESSVFKRKLQVFIDGETFTVLNYIDNESFIEMYDDFKGAEGIKIDKRKAFAKIKDYLELKPVYVYDGNQKVYILCGRLDCQFGINAANGDLVDIHNL